MAPPGATRMHQSQMSNPFQHLNQQQSYQPPNFSQHGFGSGSLNGAGMSAFPASTYGASAFTPGAGSTVFNGGAISGQGQGLASVAAQQGFARGAAMQEHNAHQLEAASMDTKSGAAGRIRQVWRQNLDQEMALLRALVLRYPYVSMDAEFPGIVARPIGNLAGSKAEYHYQTLRCNVDLLKPIQLGITVWTTEGDLPPQQPDSILINQLNGRPPHANHLMYVPCTWVFNFKFNLSEDMFSEPSIQLLESSGVEFEKNREHGIDLDAFGSLLTTSGLCFSDDVNWLSFHSGYDFGYLIKVLTSQGLPEHQDGFFDIVSTYFPKLWDIKFLLRYAQRMQSQGRLSPDASRIVSDLGQKSGLQDLADVLQCHRVGPAHTGGSDAWLTGSVFWAMRSKIFGGELPIDQADQIYGLHGVAAPASQQYREEFFAAQGTPAQQVNGLSGAAGTYTHTPNPSTPTSSHIGLNTSQTPAQQQYGGYGGTQYNR
ncbi:hypothetical protein B0A48_09712 [Cryoendolithus antarcticus]|uniref:poly(A)-specific ribonuclease n=1 Tax=Cryoendolithus antarcticus TaxID=1507870 RepID=A0A1V8T0N8_9PEZI|nr:hypothetical protein B0A48_09712 [Cryoendolithus antarcticus]